MSKIKNVDANLLVAATVEREGLVYFDAKAEPFKLHGVWHDGGLYRRLPADLAQSMNEKIEHLATNTAGGRVRFITDSPYVAIKAFSPSVTSFSHMTRTAEHGFDMYVTDEKKHRRVKTFVPPVEFDEYYESVHDFTDEPRLRLITINFPLYGEVFELYIGLKEGSQLLPPTDYTVNKPIVYYGSSITQGGCASRPGASYPAIISRQYDADYINLGFSGNGKGEPCMAEYIANLDMSVFVYDYDHNSPSVEHYKETHEPFFKIIREKNPNLPIVFMTRPRAMYLLTPGELRKIDVALETYNNAKNAGDENVYFIPGYELAESDDNEMTVDVHHPTDLGFYFMAKRLIAELDKILK